MSASVRGFVYTLFFGFVLTAIFYLIFIKYRLLALPADKLLLLTMASFASLFSLFSYVFIKFGISRKLEDVAFYLSKIEEEMEILPQLIEEERLQEVKKILVSINMMVKQLREKLNVKLEEVRSEKVRMQNAMVEFVDSLERAVNGDYTVRMAVTPDLTGALAEIINDLLSNTEKELAEIYKLVKKAERSSDKEHVLSEIRGRLERLKFSGRF